MKAVLVGAALGVAASRALPVAATFEAVVRDAGAGGLAAQAIIGAAFAVGGGEAALLLLPLVRQWRAGRRP